MSTEAYAYKSDFNNARDFRYRVIFTNTQAAGGVAAQGNYVPHSAESLDAAGTVTVNTNDISLAIERGNMRFASIIAALSENENPVAVQAFGDTVDATGKLNNTTSFTISVEYSREPSGYPNGTLVTGSTFIEEAIEASLAKVNTGLRHKFISGQDPSTIREEVTANPMVTPADYAIVVDSPAGSF
jgi:hypothetical protein